jgi:hypothetical protein
VTKSSISFSASFSVRSSSEKTSAFRSRSTQPPSKSF